MLICPSSQPDFSRVCRLEDRLLTSRDPPPPPHAFYLNQVRTAKRPDHPWKLAA
jgi:hypothetical protein